MEDVVGEVSAVSDGQGAAPERLGVKEREGDGEGEEKGLGCQAKAKYEQRRLEGEKTEVQEAEEDDDSGSDTLLEDACDQFELRRQHSLCRVSQVGNALVPMHAAVVGGNRLSESTLPSVLEGDAHEKNNDDAPSDESSDSGNDHLVAQTGENGRESVPPFQPPSRAAARWAVVRNTMETIRVSVDTTVPLPMMCGWLERLPCDVLSASEKVWVVLHRGVLRWFADPEDKKPKGRIDFELLKCHVSKQWTPEDEIKFGLGVQKPSRCSGCDVFHSLMQNILPADAVVFHLSPEGGLDDESAVLALRANNVMEGAAWVEAIRKHIDPERATQVMAIADASRGSVGCMSFPLDDSTSFGQVCAVPMKTSSSRSSDQNWWMLKTITPAKFADIVRTGDILLFRTPGTVPGLIHSCSGGRFDHVA